MLITVITNKPMIFTAKKSARLNVFTFFYFISKYNIKKL